MQLRLMTLCHGKEYSLFNYLPYLSYECVCMNDNSILGASTCETDQVGHKTVTGSEILQKQRCRYCGMHQAQLLNKWHVMEGQHESVMSRSGN